MNCCRILKLILVTSLFFFNGFGQEIEFVRMVSDPVIQVSPHQSAVHIILQIKEGHHIQSNQPDNDWVIATTVKLDWPSGLGGGDIIFPMSQQLYLEGDDAPLLVFKDQLEIEIPVKWAHKKPPGSYQVYGQVYYQICDHKKCYFPRNYSFNFVLEVKDGRQ